MRLGSIFLWTVPPLPDCILSTKSLPSAVRLSLGAELILTYDLHYVNIIFSFFIYFLYIIAKLLYYLSVVYTFYQQNILLIFSFLSAQYGHHSRSFPLPDSMRFTYSAGSRFMLAISMKAFKTRVSLLHAAGFLPSSRTIL